jgi:hypothetical protein
MQITNNAPIDYYQIQCANCRNTFVWRQAYWQSNTPGSRDDAGYDYVSRAFCPLCGSIVCEGIGSSYWKWYGDNQLLNANNPLPPTLPPDLEWVPDDKSGEEFMEEFHRKWGKRRLPKELQVPVSQQRLDLSLLGDFKEMPFRSRKAQPHKVFLVKLREYLSRLMRGNKKKESYIHEDKYDQIEVLTNDEIDTLRKHYHKNLEILPESLPERWFFASPEESAFLWNELQKELPIGHILFHIPLKIIATQNYVTDNILCKHLSEPDRYTVVHLTWSTKTETNEKFPTVEVDGSFEDFLNYEKKLDL